MADCVFCKIRDGELPSLRLCDDDRTLVIMDINPLTSGHCLVLTRPHAPTIWDVDPEDLKAAVVMAKRVATAIQQGLKPDGLNVLQASGAAAFQSVPHFHFHLIPRWTNDGKGFDWKVTPGNREQILKNGERIRAALAK